MTISTMLEKYTSLYQHSPDIHLVTADGVSMNMSRLVLTTFSPFLRSLLISTPCCTSPILVLPFCSSTAVTSLMGLLKHGVSRQFSVDLRGLKEEVIETAEVMGVDVTGLEYWGEIKEDNNDDMVKIEVPETLEETETLDNIYINEGICYYKGASESETIEQTISENVEDKTSEQSGVKQIKYECDSNDESSEEKVPEFDPDVDLLVSEESESIVSIVITPINEDKFLTHVNNEKKTCRTPFNMKEKKGLTPLKPKPSSGSARTVHPCRVCGKSFAYQLLGNHYYSHFSTQLKERYASLCEGFVCIICGKNMKTTRSLVCHISVKHGQINEFLVDNGYQSHEVEIDE